MDRKRVMAADSALVEASRALAREVAGLRFAAPVHTVYNPLDYARSSHEAYLRRYGSGSRPVLFLGMNPGPWGMAQTGVPFGEVAAVRDWMGIEAPVGKPTPEHPKRPIEGFACGRSEVSGQRLWGLFAQRFGTAERFFAGHFVVNYCPLVFMSETGANVTPDKLPAAERAPLEAACNAHLRRLVDILQPEWLIGVGAFAEKKAREVLGGASPVRMGRILHPSPASPAANKDWSGQASRELESMGVWGS